MASAEQDRVSEFYSVVRNDASLHELFDPYQVPPNFHLTRLHAVTERQKARRVRQLQSKYTPGGEDSPAELCPCCNSPLDRSLFPLCASTRLLNELGPGFPLYFDMVTWLTGGLLLLLLIVGIFCLIDNFSAERLGERGTEMEGNVLLEASLANFGTSKSPSVVQAWLHVVGVWMLLILSSILRARHRSIKRSLDNAAITPSDYTVMVTNLPVSVSEQELSDFLEQNGRPVSAMQDKVPCKVVKVMFVYRMSYYVTVKSKLLRAKERLAVVRKIHELDLHPPFCCFHSKIHTIQHYEEELALQEEEMKKWEGLKTQRFTGVAFVTFDQDEGEDYAEAKSVAKYLNQPDFQSFQDVLKHVFCIKLQGTSRNTLQGHVLCAERAPEPTDVNWANIGVSRSRILRRRLLTWTATCAVLLGSVLCLYFTHSALEKSSSFSQSPRDQVLYSLMGLCPAMGVVVINMMLSRIIRFFTKYEKHTTNTHYDTSVAAKLTIALFLNSALVPFVVNWDDFYSSHGLAKQLNYIMLANALFYPVAYVFNPHWLIRWSCGRLEVRKRQRCMLTQLEANKLLEGRHLDMPQRYASLLKTYLLTVVYAPMLPLAFLFGALALVIQYWQDKVMLLRYIARPEMLSHVLGNSMLRVIPLGAVMYAFANWIFFYNLQPASRVPGVVGIVTSVAWLVLPWKKLAKLLRMCKSRVLPNIFDLSESDKAYEEVAVYFPDDYDRCNPLTLAEGNQTWLDLIRSKRGVEAADRMAEALQSGSRTKTLTQLRDSGTKLIRSFVQVQINSHLPRLHVKAPEITAELNDLVSCDAPLAPFSTVQKQGLLN